MFKETAIDKPAQKFMLQSSLAILECIIEMGIDDFARELEKENPDLSVFPAVRKKFDELGLKYSL